jgi:hypothetical protein
MVPVEQTHLTRQDPSQLTLDNLPASDTRRWYPRWKIFIVRAVEVGLLSFDQASKRYGLSFEEFLSWRKLAASFDQSGSNAALRAGLSSSPLWLGSDRPTNQAPIERDSSDSFQRNLF